MRCKVIEGVLEVTSRWGIRMAKTDIVGSNQVELVGESRNQLAKHLAAGRKSMQ